ncbi:hypothetical protein [Pseudomonas lini]|uniref:hypothetical protein n=1 Tax=Pseudomonas lini TaxID=163011 RepID=UPI00345E3E5B
MRASLMTRNLRLLGEVQDGIYIAFSFLGKTSMNTVIAPGRLSISATPDAGS